MFDWLKRWFVKEQKTNEIIPTQTIILNNERFDITSLKDEVCLKHPEYLGVKPPTNNCNDCWEFHSKRVRWNK